MQPSRIKSTLLEIARLTTQIFVGLIGLTMFGGCLYVQFFYFVKELGVSAWIVVPVGSVLTLIVLWPFGKLTERYWDPFETYLKGKIREGDTPNGDSKRHGLYIVITLVGLGLWIMSEVVNR